ncbi:S49 family peptidase [Flavobacterium sp.]|uniref:S49 family peptidase n=1 Tax=Flavobacterium sp. TaxID=239 RepID=UPI00260CBA31|nr:S49 family peptidase [Flavobacterium sp.]
MKVNNLITDLYKGQWAISIDASGYLYRIANDIVAGKEMNLNLKAKQLIDFYDENSEPIKPNEDGFVEIPEGSTAVINMIGPIITYGDYCTYGADEIIKQFEKLDRNPNIKSIIVFMDGPGGAVSAISPFLNFGATRDKKKVLGVVYEQMCSAHLYIAYGLQPDFVWASNNITANAGSLGVMVSWINDKKYLELQGLEKVAVYPDESSDKNLPLRLAIEGNYDMIKTEMLSPLAQRFQQDMIRLNPNLKSKVPGVLTGKVFYADDAIEVGFANRVGTMSEAMKYVQTLSELNHYKPNV